jgi:hypothetical protein
MHDKRIIGPSFFVKALALVVLDFGKRAQLRTLLQGLWSQLISVFSQWQVFQLQYLLHISLLHFAFALACRAGTKLRN